MALGLLARGLIGNHLTSFRILVANTKYASSAARCVANVLSRFIHILRYLSDPVSLTAAYHAPDDRCLSTMARRRPPRPVTPETCLRQADLSEARGSSSSEMGESTRLGGDLERFGLEGVEAVLEDVGLVGDAGLGLDGALAWGADLLDDAVLKDPILGDEGLDVDSLVSLDFEDVFLGVDASAGEGVFGEVVFETVAGGAVAFGGATLGVVSFGGAVLDNLAFEDEACWLAAFAEASLDALFFEVVTGAGLGSGARSIRDATGTLVGAAENCPLAIWRARSFTLTNILTGQ